MDKVNDEHADFAAFLARRGELIERMRLGLGCTELEGQPCDTDLMALLGDAADLLRLFGYEVPGQVPYAPYDTDGRPISYRGVGGLSPSSRPPSKRKRCPRRERARTSPRR